MVQLAATEKCTGCMACAVSCPQSAIGVEQDSLGNIYPKIQEDLCIRCGKCQRVCPEMHDFDTHEPIKAYAAWALDPENRKTSASGGVASVFYEQALESNYWICGAEFTPDGHVIHTLTNTADAILRYKQSKYVYSEMRCVYKEIKRCLDNGESVLMISLPCKIAGLLGYLGKTYDNLLTVDIVCHGTPSNQLLREHIENIAPELEAFSLRFRQDNEFYFLLETNGKVRYRKIGKTDTYMAAFLEGLSYRDACYQCSYAKPQRISDLTICDFWGLGVELPFNHPYTGAVSAVIVNSAHGQSFLDKCKPLLFVEERPVSEAIKGNAQMNTPTAIHPKRNDFKIMHQEQGFEKAVSVVLQREMKAAQKEINRWQMRLQARKLAGLFLKRYRG